MAYFFKTRALKWSLCLWTLFCVSSLGFIPLSHPNKAQILDLSPKQVAIIGAGAAGSSAAYSLNKEASLSGRPVNITVFEQASYVGGRSTTVNVFDNPAYPIELGASIFVKVNHILVNASREFGLDARSADYARPRESDDTLGVWDGEQFVLVISDSSSWWNIGKVIWRYGWAPIRTQNLMKSTVNKFLQLYNEPMFPFKSLTAAAAAVGLLDTTATPGQTFLSQNSISSDFAREVIQASTRVNYGQNLPLIHGLESMVCMATDGAMAVEGGNWQIFDGMLRAAGANIRLNHTVTSITRNVDNTLTLGVESGHVEQELAFDEVVLAGPHQFSKIAISEPLERNPDKIPFVTLHVTLFSSPHRLSPKYFGLKGPTAHVPETVLTTLPRGTDLGSSEKGVGPSGFWSISTLRTVDPPNNNQEKHYVYKIFSPERPTAQFVMDILGLEDADDDSTTTTTTARKLTSTIGDLSKEDISWFHEKVWNPYPFLYPRVTFEEISLAPNLWYTGGIESFISTMETSALMGKNVASLIFQSWQEQQGENEEKVDVTIAASQRVEL